MLGKLTLGATITGFVALLLGSCAPDLVLDLKSQAAGGMAGAAGTAGGTAGTAGAGIAPGGSGGGGGDSAAGAGDAPGTCLTCANCTSDKDCANRATETHCNLSTTGMLAGLCVGCLTTSDCDSPRACDPVTLQCVPPCTMLGDPACGSQGRLCDVSLMYCVECLTSSDCSAPTPICNHDCVECTSDGDCAATNQKCWLQRHTCVDCVGPQDCPSNESCTGKHVCATP